MCTRALSSSRQAEGVLGRCRRRTLRVVQSPFSPLARWPTSTGVRDARRETRLVLCYVHVRRPAVGESLRRHHLHIISQAVDTHGRDRE